MCCERREFAAKDVFCCERHDFAAKDTIYCEGCERRYMLRRLRKTRKTKSVVKYEKDECLARSEQEKNQIAAPPHRKILIPKPNSPGVRNDNNCSVGAKGFVEDPCRETFDLFVLNKKRVGAKGFVADPCRETFDLFVLNKKRVGAKGFEPSTSCTPCKRASRSALRPELRRLL